jgi:hypothetical protein
VRSEHEAEDLDLVQRHFGPGTVLDARYVGDITYIATWEGWAYLATVIDLASRRVVGWALADHMRTKLVSDALTMAFATRRPPAGAIFHSDRGCQYTSRDSASSPPTTASFCPWATRGRAGTTPWRNRFSLELIDRRPWSTITVLRRAVFECIGGVVQHPPAAFLAWLPQPRPVRSSHPPKHEQPRGIISSTNLYAKARQLHSIANMGLDYMTPGRWGDTPSDRYFPPL